MFSLGILSNMNSAFYFISGQFLLDKGNEMNRRKMVNLNRKGWTKDVTHFALCLDKEQLQVPVKAKLNVH